MLVNTMVPIFHAQNLLHILKKKARIKFLNFIQKYMVSVFSGEVILYVMYPVLSIYISEFFLTTLKICRLLWILLNNSDSDDDKELSVKKFFLDFTSAKVYLPATSSVLKFSIAVMKMLSTCSEIFNIFRHSLIRVCAIISYVFLYSINIMATISLFTLGCVDLFIWNRLVLSF